MEQNPQDAGTRETSKALQESTNIKFGLQTGTTKNSPKPVATSPRLQPTVGTLKAHMDAVKNRANEKSPSKTSYVSQAGAMRAKAVSQGLQSSVLDAFYDEKMKVANSRFSAETEDWRAWFAESTVWGKFCK